MAIDPEQSRLDKLRSALNHISRALTASLDMEQILLHVVDAVIGLTSAERGFVALLDAESRGWQLRCLRSFNQGTLRYDEIRFAQKVVGIVVDSGLSMVVADTQSDPRFAQQDAGDYPPPRSCMCSPLISRDQVIGAIYVDHLTQVDLFCEDDLDMFNAFAAQVAMVVENDQLHQTIQRTNQAKSEFVSVVTHELRIPMTSIKGYTDLLRQGAVGPVNEQQVEFLNVIRNNVERMSALISDLSDISKIESDRLMLESAFIPLQKYVEEVLGSFSLKLDEKYQSLEVDVSPDLPKIYADPNRLMQVMSNLMSNAWLYTPDEGQIGIRAFQQDEFLRVEVSDNGIGISTEDQAKVFSQFFRSEDPEVREKQGWGLGLNVAKHLVEFMGGDIGFQSTLGQGSTFWFTLLTSEKERKT